MPSARGLSRLRAIEDDFAAFRDQLMRIAPASPERSKTLQGFRTGFVSTSSWVLTSTITSGSPGSMPSLELDRVHASFPEMTHEPAPPRVLDCDVKDQRRHDRNEQGVPETRVRRRDHSDDVCEQIADHDPGSRPQQGSSRGVEQEEVHANGDHAGQTGGEWVHARQKLRDDEVSRAMCGEPLLGVTDE